MPSPSRGRDSRERGGNRAAGVSRMHQPRCGLDSRVLIGGDEPATFNTEGEDMLGEALPPRSYHRNLEELDELLGSVGNFGFSLKHADDEDNSDDSDEDDKDEE